MCGRYLYDDWGNIIDTTGTNDLVRYRRKRRSSAANYNAAPSQVHPIGLNLGEGLMLDEAIWGLTRPVAGGKLVFQINAKAENLHFTFGDAYCRPSPVAGRCIVPCNGFYEWQKPSRQPYKIQRADGKPTAFAGVWVQLQDSDDLAYVVITCEPAAEVAPIHNRQPVILEPESWSAWADPATSYKELKTLLRALPEGSLQTVKVGPRVSNVKNNDADCALAIE